jgi:hypothetical protein
MAKKKAAARSGGENQLGFACGCRTGRSCGVGAICDRVESRKQKSRLSRNAYAVMLQCNLFTVNSSIQNSLLKPRMVIRRYFLESSATEKKSRRSTSSSLRHFASPSGSSRSRF